MRGLDARDPAGQRPTRIGRRTQSPPRSSWSPARHAATSSASASPRATRCCWSRSGCPRTASRASSPRTWRTARSTTCSAERYATQIARTRETLEPVLLRAREAGLLERPRRGAGAARRGHRLRRADGAPVEFGRTYVRGDRTRYYVERGRRCDGARRRSRAPDGVTRHVGTHDRPGEERGGQADGGRVRSSAVTERGHASATSERTRTSAEPSCHRHAASRRPGRPAGPATRRRSTAAAPAREPACAGDRPARRPRPSTVEIRWFCCLGTGDAPQLAGGERGRRRLQRVARQHQARVRGRRPTRARDTLATQIASGNPPTSSGRSGVGGADAFHGQWLDLRRSSQKTGYDLTPVRAGRRRLLQDRRWQLGIPFAIYPSMMWYKRDMFEEAGLNQPPHKYGEQYKMPDGTEVDWDYDTITQLAKMLTVDKNGNSTRRRRASTRPRSSSTASSRSATTCAGWAPTSGRAS